MTEKIGRNDPCPCGSGKKYKNCCIEKAQPRTTFGGRKFTAKVLSSGGMKKTEASQESGQIKAAVDYATLMERSFGQALQSHEEKPPVPGNPSDYLAQDKPKE